MTKTPPLSYRPDIDILRCFAVLAVLFFHISATGGGFIGVDIFFVISGYIMYLVNHNKNFLNIGTAFNFYKKRLFRIYPALLMMLFLTLCVGFVLLDIERYDYLGKQTFFAGLSLSNILYAKGHNYFSAQTPMLLHTWSLGVEMQFYILFPVLIIILKQLQKVHNSVDLFVLCAISIICALWAHMTSDQSASFYLLQNRGFEFLIGMLAARVSITKYPRYIYPPLIIGIVLCAVFFKNGAYHPGAMTLFPVLISAGILMLHASSPKQIYETLIARGAAYIGKISYGIYLYHFPVILFTKQLAGENPWIITMASILITLPLSHLSYQYFETPLRQYGYKSSSRSHILMILILGAALLLSATGYIIAKKEGVPERLRYLNGFAYKASQIHTPSKESFKRGYHVKNTSHGRILFIGDSVLQQYIDPITRALNIPKQQVDSITRGGCVLLKGVDFDDIFTDISCDDLRHSLYNLEKRYDYIIISQSWHRYHDALKNAYPTNNDQDYEYIAPFITKTLDHLKHQGTNIILLGLHPIIEEGQELAIGPVFQKSDYIKFKSGLRIKEGFTVENRAILDKIAEQSNVQIIHPIDIFCHNDTLQCLLSNDEWSYFSDEEHLSRIGQDIAQNYFAEALQ